MKTTTLTLSDNCPKCGTKTLELDPEGDIHCWACGTTFPDGKKPQQRITRDYLLARHRFYEDNKTTILADVQSIGKKATAKKWGINDASLWQVLKRWEKDIPERKNRRGRCFTTEVHTNGRLPAFPAFSDSWQPAVQLKWLELYEKLLDRRLQEEVKT